MSEKHEINRNLLTSLDVSRVLGISRQRVQQLVVESILPPKYVFNKGSQRKFYLFDRETVTRFSNKETRRSIKWQEPEESDLLSVSDVVEHLNCPRIWVYEMTKNGHLKPDLVAGANGKRLVYLYSKELAEKAWNTRRERATGPRGHRGKTLELMDKIRERHAKKKNDCSIAKELGVSQPLITRLRTEMGLKRVVSRGKPKRRCKVMTQSKLEQPLREA